MEQGTCVESVLGVPYGAGYMWGVVCKGYPMEQGTCGE